MRAGVCEAHPRPPGPQCNAALHSHHRRCQHLLLHQPFLAVQHRVWFTFDPLFLNQRRAPSNLPGLQ